MKSNQLHDSIEGLSQKIVSITLHYMVFNPEPLVLMSDFEASLIEVVQLQFPHARDLGCHFHFGQAL